MKIAVIGGGLMGRAIALEFALAGHLVSVRDVSDKQTAVARQAIKLLGAQLVDLGVRVLSDVLAAQERIALTTSLPEAATGAGYVVEAVPEILELKHAVFAELDACAPPSAIFASNTSSFRPDQLAATLSPSRRLVIAHYFNPAHLVPLVEVAPGQGADTDTIEFVTELLQDAGKVPVPIKRAVNGLVANRLQTALVREALHLLAEGVVEPADLDRILTAGLGPRWAAVGPLAVADLGGFKTWASAFRSIAPDLDNAVDVPAALTERIAQGQTGVDSGRGFYEWTEAAVNAVVARRNQMLIAAAQINGYRRPAE